MTPQRMWPEGAWPDCRPAWQRQAAQVAPDDQPDVPPPRVLQGRLWAVCPRHGVVIPTRHRLGFPVCSRCFG